MSERTPRPGGRAAEPQRGTTARRTTGSGRDADAQRGQSIGGAGRGARRSDDTRRSGMRGQDTRRAGARDEELPRSRTRGRDTEGVRAGRDTEGVRAGRDRKAEVSLGGSLNGRAAPSAAERQNRKDAPERRSRMAEAVGGRGKVRALPGDVDAPVAGTAALRIEPGTLPDERAAAKPAGPRLRVAPPLPISAPRAPFVAGVLALVIAGVIGILLINTKTAENSFRITDLQNQNSELSNQQQSLDNQIVDASKPGNLYAAARRLGMVRAEKLALFVLPGGKVIGVPTPADQQVAVTAQDPKKAGEAAVEDKGAANVVPADGRTAPGTGQ